MAKQGWSSQEILDALLDPRNGAGVWLRRLGDPEAVLARLFESVDWDRLPYLPTAERHRRIRVLLSENGVMSQKALVVGVGHANSGQVRKDLVELAAAGVVRRTEVPHGQVTWYEIELIVSEPEALDRELEIRRQMARAIAQREARRRYRRGVLRTYGSRAGVSSLADDEGEQDPDRYTPPASGDWLNHPSLAEMLAAPMQGDDVAGFVSRPVHDDGPGSAHIVDGGASATVEVDRPSCLCVWLLPAGSVPGSHEADCGQLDLAGQRPDVTQAPMTVSWLEEEADFQPTFGEPVQNRADAAAIPEPELTLDEFTTWCTENL